nr:MFS transporter [Mesorhizobium loti]
MLNLASCFGQTFFISLFSGDIRAEFGLTHSSFGLLYMVATLGSAASILWVGRLVDVYSARKMAVCVVLATAVAAVLTSYAHSLIIFFIALYLLRFCGQGMLDHLAGVTMTRWYDLNRGRALSIASLGHPVGEALLPLAGVVLIAAIGWRQTWLVVACVLLFAAMPVFLWLLKTTPLPEVATQIQTARRRRAMPLERTSGQVIRDPLFYVVLLGIQSHSLITTGIFFHQIQIASLKDWSIAWLAANYPIYAGLTVVTSLIAGEMVDKWSARVLLPVGLIPLATACLVLALFSNLMTVPVFMGLIGIASGFVGPVTGALWAEIYGREHLGAIRSITMASSVVASALAPGFMGMLFDLAVPIEQQMFGFALYTLVAALLLFCLAPTLNRIAMAGADG